MDKIVVRKKIMEELERGKASTNHVRSLVLKRASSKGSDDQDYNDYDCGYNYYKEFDDHSMVILSSFTNALSLMNNNYNMCGDDFEGGLKKGSMGNSYKLEGHDQSGEDTCHKVVTPIKDRRGCYKRRKTGHTEVMETQNLIDDGYAWRKYGQKSILNNDHPRNYYRCTHKGEGCPATKQVQQISLNPTMYRIIYHGNHTCKNLLKTTPIIIDPTIEDNSSGSTIMLNFETNYSPSLAKHPLNNNPFLFPSSTSTSSSSFASTSTLKENNLILIKEESQSGPHDRDRTAHIHQYSSSSNSTSPYDMKSSATTTEVYSSTASPHGLKQDLSYINMADNFIDFDEEELIKYYLHDHEDLA